MLKSFLLRRVISPSWSLTCEGKNIHGEGWQGDCLCSNILQFYRCPSIFYFVPFVDKSLLSRSHLHTHATNEGRHSWCDKLCISIRGSRTFGVATWGVTGLFANDSVDFGVVLISVKVSSKYGCWVPSSYSSKSIDQLINKNLEKDKVFGRCMSKSVCYGCNCCCYTHIKHVVVRFLLIKWKK